MNGFGLVTPIRKVPMAAMRNGKKPWWGVNGDRAPFMTPANVKVNPVPHHTILVDLVGKVIESRPDV